MPMPGSISCFQERIIIISAMFHACMGMSGLIWAIDAHGLEKVSLVKNIDEALKMEMKHHVTFKESAVYQGRQMNRWILNHNQWLRQLM